MPDGSPAPRDAGRSPVEVRLPGGVAVIGLGLIGGSLARALVRQGIAVSGWADSAEDRRLAADAGVSVPGDAVDGARAAAHRCGTVVLAVPVASVAPLAAELAAKLASNAVVLHTSGLQRREALALDDALVARVVGTHPMAGSHHAGFAASRADLFAGAIVSVEERSTALVRARAEALWRLAGASRLVYRTAEDHDRLMAWVSHLPQLTATALAATLDSVPIDPATAGPGARDTTRLAESPLALWADLLRAAPPDTALALRRLRQELEGLERAIVRGDVSAISKLWSAASAWRRAADRPE